ncbi:hypothetical protein [Flavihumibacter solisilvae]|uniref:Uncharacterized protein n=1 Tax=Flavihumibacter solisilvae TaxID=1349421 RepID=A0A0C1IX66_9BACT|nr:hypothetical protein [Flavihumibacter solisilvae]KIC95019.1 hypothetical protein OI18_09055 [Flavihumibacter solisilvae]
MKPRQLEILIHTDFRSATKLIDAKQSKRSNEVYWNGIFHANVLQLFADILSNKFLSLWKVLQAQYFINLEYSVTRKDLEPYFSLNPYTFLQQQHLQ